MKEIFEDIISSIQSHRKLASSSKDDEFWNEMMNRARKRERGREWDRDRRRIPTITEKRMNKNALESSGRLVGEGEKKSC